MLRVQHSHNALNSPSSNILLTRVCCQSIPTIFASGTPFLVVFRPCCRRHSGRERRFQSVGVHHHRSMLLADLHCQHRRGSYQLTSCRDSDSCENSISSTLCRSSIQATVELTMRGVLYLTCTPPASFVLLSKDEEHNKEYRTWKRGRARAKRYDRDTRMRD